MGIAIIDYGAGNLRNVARAIAKLGYEAHITSQPEEVRASPVVILPGVGATGDVARTLERLGLAQAIREVIVQGRPFLGVCLGLQVLFQSTEEGGVLQDGPLIGQPCLGVLPGVVKRLPEGLKVPHMGWNQVRQRVPHPILEGIPQDANFYFVHSYYAEPSDPSWVVGETEYGLPFCSVLARDNLVATQFHPEKSGELGLKMYDNFLRNAFGDHPGH